ncbi:MAG: hypothetical protein FJY75_04485 [Candidatus Eisenbacteria bacterium]|uniref:Uncharacterized protein n=1 Tax=Eiseniibacteriota bacterium TaxID=2212470 RepID=A0A937XA77_UNCEI|nr:hypothetical protein [Candidatus Eisenbacteria bacterium]
MDRASGTPPLPRPRPAPRTPIGSGAPSAASFRLDTGGGALSPQPALDGALRGLLAAAIPRLIDAAGGLRPRALLLLGSAAAGEACGVEAGGGRWIPLSDIDLALIVDSAPRAAERARVRDAVALALERERARLGLAADPLDIAIVARRALRELPVTIEWAEAFARPTLLWGELSGPAGEAGAFRPPFEALRLLLNRIAELALESSGPAPTGGEAPADWPASPEERDWRRAHRWAKLPLDAWKAWLAARGEIEPSAAGRLVFLEGMGRAECMERMERPERPESPERPEPPAPAETPERPGRTEHPRAASRPPGAAALDAAAPGWRGLVADWTAWRLRPAWPPPQADPAAVGALADAVLGDLLSGLIGEDFRWSEARHWRLALAAEGGSARERLRRWRAVLASRPGGVGRARAARLAIRWRRAWPASLGILVAGLAWTAAVRRPEEAPALRARLAREFPLCQDPGNGAGEAASPGVPGRLAGWLRSGGG